MSIATTHVLDKACTTEVWNGSDAAGVCRDYKALWGMTLVGSYVFLRPMYSDRFEALKTNYLCN